MKILFALIFTISFLRLSYAQDISKQVIASSGKTISNSTHQITSTIGEAVVGLKSNTVSINQGFLAAIISSSTLTEPEFNINNTIKLYPNPVIEDLHFDLGNKSNALVNIYDSTGKKILKEQLNNKSSTINLNYLQNGIYLIQLQFEDQKSIKTFKILKQ